MFTFLPPFQSNKCKIGYGTCKSDPTEDKEFDKFDSNLTKKNLLYKNEKISFHLIPRQNLLILMIA